MKSDSSQELLFFLLSPPTPYTNSTLSSFSNARVSGVLSLPRSPPFAKITLFAHFKHSLIASIAVPSESSNDITLSTGF